MRSLEADHQSYRLARQALKRLISSAVLAALILLTLLLIDVRATDVGRYDGWYFTADEVGAAYQYQENYGQRLRHPLRAGSCVFRGGEFNAELGKNNFTMPCRFVLQITRHLKEMIEAGAAKFLFPLDADHAHLGVPVALWESKYKHLSAVQVVRAIVREPQLVALYHTAEHLRITDRKTGAVDKTAASWQAKRNVLGFFDGRRIEILPPNPSGQGASMPEGYFSYSGFSFLASPRGELYLPLGTKVITFDIALDGSAAEQFDERNHFFSESANLTRTSP